MASKSSVIRMKNSRYHWKSPCKKRDNLVENFRHKRPSLLKSLVQRKLKFFNQIPLEVSFLRIRSKLPRIISIQTDLSTWLLDTSHLTTGIRCIYQCLSHTTGPISMAIQRSNTAFTRALATLKHNSQTIAWNNAAKKITSNGSSSKTSSQRKNSASGCNIQIRFLSF